MKHKICLYTCVTGDYDSLREIKNIEKNIDYLCFTNNKSLTSKTWKIIHIDNDGLDNHHLSRKIKILGHPTISKNYEVSVWMDTSVTWQRSISDFVNTYLKETSFAAIKHSQRHSIHEEAIACLQLHKDTKENITRTLSFLEANQFPDNLGLYEMTVFIKRHNDEAVKKTMEIWFNMIQQFSKRDQLSFMYAIWKTGLTINPIQINIWDNNWFTNHKHKTQTESSTFDIYFGNPNLNFSFDRYYSIRPKQHQNTFIFSLKIPDRCNIIYLYLPNIPGLICEDITTIAPVNNHDIINATPYYNSKLIFLSTNGLIILHGAFEKDKELNFHIKLQQTTLNDLVNYTEELCITNSKLINQQNSLADKNKALKNENRSLKKEINAYSQELQSVYTSKSWRMIRKFRQLLPPYNK